MYKTWNTFGVGGYATVNNVAGNTNVYYTSQRDLPACLLLKTDTLLLKFRASKSRSSITLSEPASSAARAFGRT